MRRKIQRLVNRLRLHSAGASPRSSVVRTRSDWMRSLLAAAVMAVGVTSIAVSQTPIYDGPAVSADESQELGSQTPGTAYRGSTATPPGGGVGLVDPSEIAKVAAAGDMIGFSHSDASGTQTITVLHAGKSWMAVYHIDGSGTIQLKSSRPIDADFSLQLNATSPLPDEIRQMGRR